jgi:hypothetical protein
MKELSFPGWLTPLAMEILKENLRLNPELVEEKAKNPGLKIWLKEQEGMRLEAEQRAFRSLGGSPRAAAEAVELQDGE